MIKIEHGCQNHPQFDNAYIYTVSTNKAYRGDYQEPLKVELGSVTYSFVTDNGEKPEIGDFISGGKLVKRQEIQVNSDWRMWKDKDLYGNP